MKSILSLVLLTVTFATSSFAIDACPTSISGSCTTVANNTCMDMLANIMPMDQFQAQCAAAGNKFSTSPCASANLTGSCVLKADNGPEVMIMRMYAPFPANMMTMMCTQSHGRLCQ